MQSEPFHQALECTKITFPSYPLEVSWEPGGWDK